MKIVEKYQNNVAHNSLRFERVEYIEFFVSNAKVFSYFLCNAFGFEVKAYLGLETGVKDRTSYLLEQGNCRFIITAGVDPESEVSKFTYLHGDGVKEVAFKVGNVEEAYKTAIDNGAKNVKGCYQIEDENGIIHKAIIGSFGETVNSFINKSNYKGKYLPGFKEITSPFTTSKNKGLLSFDHIVGNVELGNMNRWTQYYEKALGFTKFQGFSKDEISTKLSGLMSKVLENGDGRIKFLINEPVTGKTKSQIQEYLDFNYGPGIQHIAFETNNIVKTVSELQMAGVEFYNAPDAYYDDLNVRVGNIDENLDHLRDLNILVDRDDEGYLLQIFVKPLTDRPTIFFEIIQRKGSKGFGKGNIKALYEAVEKEQALRGTL
ncbi:4-hydroxyphenylpyruvate dioxygenase [Alkalihalobacillus sp. TS-13]|uniref:4-hydroxyphenylpyruvate dioxygenase n=1 Tax=Alkalihalobacillus sp. TS-13 TaxID=2842455 RepID=UPI001C86A58A|nr:4-hydroxyphenylpyruvate dioxygenase [Alkalihalobacillus sp. TS-13]